MQEFEPYYQPIVGLNDGELKGFELLARWNRADGKIIGPDVFVSIAEESGMINDLMLQMLEQMCVDTVHWPDHLTVAINLSSVQLKDSWLGHKILAVLLKHGVSPRRLAVEITETAIVSDEKAALRTITSLQNQGVSVSLDDFGTGYSSMHYLRAFPFDKLKIDRSFILSLLDNEDSEKIVSSIIGLANNLGLTVVAEGIETAAVACKLRAMGCSQGQGYLFSRPLQGKAAAAYIADQIPALDEPAAQATAPLLGVA